MLATLIKHESLGVTLLRVLPLQRGIHNKVAIPSCDKSLEDHVHARHIYL